jgi:dUTP pyrophosphatase
MFKLVRDEFRVHPDVQIKLPKRGTTTSSGYDISTPVDITVEPGCVSSLVLTDVCVELLPDEFLMIVPRSSLGIKRNLMLVNTVGIIDSDYYDNVSNGGNIGIKLYNFGKDLVTISAGEKLVQGIILKYETFGEFIAATRDGGFGSTSK